MGEVEPVAAAHEEPQRLASLAVVGGVVLLGLSLASLARNPEPRLLPRWAWAVVCIVTLPVGCVAYLLLGQPERKALGPVAAELLERLAARP